MKSVTRDSPVVLRWDLDKTYLVSDFESLRALVRVPFERGRDKTAVPGVVALIRGLRRVGQRRRRPLQLFFLSGSPRQLARAVRDKLAIDGIDYDGITFKDQVQHLMRGHFDALREQVGYKLSELLVAAHATAPGSQELLFGDDWESDPFVYSLYADIVAGRIDRDRALRIVDRIGVERVYREPIAAALSRPLPDFRVAGVFVLRQKPRQAVDLEAFGHRLHWFDNYFECALMLEAAGLLDAAGVVDVARDLALKPDVLSTSFERVVARFGGPSRAALDVPRQALAARGLLDRGPRPRWFARSLGRLKRRFGSPAAPLPRSTTVPPYEELVRTWTRARRDERGENRNHG